MDVLITGSELSPDIQIVTINALAPGCTGYLPFTRNTTLTVQALPTVNPVFSARSCSNNPVSITLVSTPSGANYTWSVAGLSGSASISGPVSGTTPGISHTVNNIGTVDYLIYPSIGVCAGTPKRITVTVTGAPNVNLPVKADSVCGGATALVSISNSEPGILYELMNGSIVISSLVGTGNTLSITVPGADLPIIGPKSYALRASGCTSTFFSPNPTVEVLSNPTVPIITKQIANGTDCDKLNTTLSVNPGNTRYQWRLNNIKIAGADSNAYIPVTNGSYTAEIYTGNNCSIQSNPIDIIFTESNTKPTITARGPAGKDTLLICNTIVSSYQWYIGKRAIVGATQQNYRPYFSAAYKVRTNPKGKCSAYSDDYYLNNTEYDPLIRYNFEMTDSTIVIDPLKIKNQAGTLEITPNPASEQFTIHYSAHKRNSTVMLTLYNAQGVQLINQTRTINDLGNLTVEVQRDNLASGIYKVVITDGQDRISKNLVLQ